MKALQEEPAASGERAAPDYSIAVLDRALDLLEALAAAPGPLGVTEAARQVGASKSAAFRVLSNLERRGYVGKDLVTARYVLGTRLAFLGERSLETLDLRQLARPSMEALHRQFGETVNLGVLVGAEVVYIDMMESDHGLRMAARVGARDRAHSTALGKAMLAYLVPERQKIVLSRPLAQLTARTITDADDVRAELALVRARGLAEDNGENEIGARCVAAPIFDHGGAVIGAISISAPESRLDDRQTAEAGEAVKAAARAVTERVGGHAHASRFVDASP